METGKLFDIFRDRDCWHWKE